MRRPLLLVLLSVVVLTACRQTSADASGAEMYAELCANCHGDNLEGGVGPALGPGSAAEAQPDGYYVVSITRGKGRMPSFPGLSDDQVARLIAYIREQQTAG